MSTFRAFRSFVYLSVFACTPVHSNSLTTSTDSLARIAGALTKQLTCLTSSSNTRAFHSGSGAWLLSWIVQLSQLWSVAARLVGGLRGAARRVGLAMTDQELLPTARNITDNLERRADRNRRGIETLMTKLEAELGQQQPQKKG